MTGLVLVTALLVRTQSPAPDQLRDPFELAPIPESSDSSARAEGIEPTRAPRTLPSDLVDPFTRTVTARPNLDPSLARPLPADLVDPFAPRPRATPMGSPAPIGPSPSALADPFRRQS